MPAALHPASGMRRAAAARYVQLALVLAALAWPPLATTQQAGEDPEIEAVRVAVAKALARADTELSFEALRLVRDKLGTVVCGTVNGKRFLAGPSGKPPPQIEGALDAPIFNYLWNARCQGMSASAADETLGRELK